MMMQCVHALFFWGMAAGAVLLALAVVNTRKLLRAAVALMGALSVTAGFYMMLDAQFLAGIQVLVYVGGIVVLIVFAIMLTRSGELLEDNPPLRRKLIGAAVSIAFLVATGGALWVSPFPVVSGTETHAGNEAVIIGKALLSMGPGGYMVSFEVISLLLLAAMLGGIVIARKTPPPNQPFTSGGDLPGETEAHTPLSQRDPRPGGRAS